MLLPIGTHRNAAMAAAPRSMAAPLTTPQHAAGTYRPAEQISQPRIDS
jgi:hypothetical protein